MNTLTANASYIEPGRARDYVTALDGLEFNFRKTQLDEIKELHNDGNNFKEIAREVYRHEYEIIIALLHLVREGHYVKPMSLL